MLRRLSAAAIAWVCFSLAAVGVCVALADLAGVTARVTMRRWEKGLQLDSLQDWDTAFRRLALSRRLNPLNADDSADVGHLLEWRSWALPPADPERHELLLRARRFHVEAIDKRPSWGFAWAHYAENRLLSESPDEQFVAALHNAMQLAPWEPGVQRKVAWMGMAAWSVLPKATRSMVEESIGRSVELEPRPDELVRLAIQYGWLDRLAPMMRTPRASAALERVLGQR